MTRSGDWAAPAAIAAAAALAYEPTLALGWWRDDFTWLFAPLRFPAVFWDFADADAMGRYRPAARTLAAAVGTLGLDARLPSRLICIALLAIGAWALARFVRELAGGDRLAGTIAGCAYVASHRVAIAATWVSLWPAQIALACELVALGAFARWLRAGAAGARRPTALATAVAAALVALTAFETSVHLPLAMAVLAARDRRRGLRRRLALPVALAAVAALVATLHLADPDAPPSHVPSLAGVPANLGAFAAREGAVLAAGGVACAALALGTGRRALAATFAALAGVGLAPGITSPAGPDVFLFLLTYAACCGAGGAAVATALRATLGPRADGVALLVAIALACGLHGRAGVVGLAERETDLRDSRTLLRDLAATRCFGGEAAWVAPLGLDARDRAVAFTTPAGAPTHLSGLCGAPVRLELDPAALARPDCRANAYFLGDDGRLVPCATLAGDGHALGRAIACGRPVAPPTTAVASDAGALRHLCTRLPRGQGVAPGRAAVDTASGHVTFHASATAVLEARRETSACVEVVGAAATDGADVLDVYVDEAPAGRRAAAACGCFPLPGGARLGLVARVGDRARLVVRVQEGVACSS